MTRIEINGKSMYFKEQGKTDTSIITSYRINFDFENLPEVIEFAKNFYNAYVTVGTYEGEMTKPSLMIYAHPDKETYIIEEIDAV